MPVKRSKSVRSRPGGRHAAKQISKKATKANARAEKKRLQLAARRAANNAAQTRAPRHVALLAAGPASRAAAPHFAQRLIDSGFVARVIRDGIANALDETLVSDALLVLFTADERDLDDSAINQISAIRAQGLPEVLSVQLSEPDKELRKYRARVLAAYSLGEESDMRAVDADSVERKLKLRAPREIAWRTRYGYLAVENAQIDNQSFSLQGWMRGKGMCANALVHLGGFGTFVCEKIVEVDSGLVLSSRGEDGDDPTESATPDPNAGEQTWIPEIENEGDTFCAESDGEHDMEDDIQEQRLEQDDAAMNEDEKPSAPIETESKDGEDDLDVDLDEMDVDEEIEKQKRVSVKTDEQFPDEVDTPVDRPARERFARYRGLKSFRTSTWDPKEQLPRDYATLFQFRDSRATKKRALARMEQQSKSSNFAASGKRVRVVLRGVSDEVKSQVDERVKSGDIVVLSSVLKHENKRSVVHFGVNRIDESEEPIKAKDRMTARVGFVSFSGRPMFSEQNSNSDKHKMARYLMHGRYTVASFYGPAVHHPAPALLFREQQLVATGSSLGADPDRIVLKRIVLTGYPFKSQKRKAVVKLMFFDPNDIRWFKPVELWTKLGRIGNILEPIGTKGLMKCIFDSALLHHDTVCMSLWKRVYPKL